MDEFRLDDNSPSKHESRLVLQAARGTITYLAEDLPKWVISALDL